MRRDINWKTKRDDGSKYEVRITWFSGKFKFQFREAGSDSWDYERVPERQDLEDLVENISRRYQRRAATFKELEEAKRLLEEK
jgi:hypothetical protein